MFWGPNRMARIRENLKGIHVQIEEINLKTIVFVFNAEMEIIQEALWQF